MATRQNRRDRFISPAFLISALILLVLIAVASAVSGWRVSQIWPLVLAAAGIAGVISSLGSKGKVATGYLISSIGFFLLGVVFAQFSFRIVPVSFGRFVLMWWPSFLVAGVVCLLSAYGYSRFNKNRAGLRQENRNGSNSAKRAGKRS
jgi:FtsH-binding integral membrane protein